MPRPARQLVESGIYHIMIRGVNKQNIFLEDKDRQMFKRILFYYKRKLNCKIYAYCLMDNHVHLLFSDKEYVISDFMRNIGSVYAGQFNKKYKRVGHLFQDRFKSICVYDDVYLLRLIRYIHRNPERAGISKTEYYKWSSYKEYIGKENIIEKEDILNKFDEDYEKAITKFKQFIAKSDEEKMDKIYLKEKLDDEEAKELIRNVTGINNLEKIKSYNKEKKKEIIKEILKIKNISVEQISKCLGIGKNFKTNMGI